MGMPMSKAAVFLNNLLDLLYPPRCPLCQRILVRKENLICPSCAGKIPFVREPFCKCCGKPIQNYEKEYCSDCERGGHYFLEGRASCIYEKGMRHAVDRLKFYNRREYVPFFGRLLAMTAREVFPLWKPSCIIPVPMHPQKRRIRGFDQSVLLARELSRLTGVPCRENLLVRTRFTKESKKLGREKRRKNMRNVFSCACPAGNRVVLLDDILTTGITMDEASLALKKAGAVDIYFLTLCIGRGE